MKLSNKLMSKISILLSLMLILGMSTQLVFASNGLNGVGENNTTVTETTTNPVQNSTDVQIPNTTPVENQGQTTTPVSNNNGSSQVEQGMGNMPDSTLDKNSVNDTVNAVSGMFNQAGPKAEDITAANAFIAPIANIINKVMAVILGVTSLLMMFTTTLDLLYLAFPPVRDLLDGGRQGMGNMAAGGRMGGSRGMGRMGGMGMGRMGGMGMGGGMGMNSMGGMGMGGMGMGGMGMGGMNGGMGMQGQQNPQQLGGGLSAVGRWVSDEAIAACLESQGGGMQGQMGMQAPVKSMVVSYMKKRALFLVLFGVCVVLFSTTVFTDLGIRLGSWMLRLIMGFGG